MIGLTFPWLRDSGVAGNLPANRVGVPMRISVGLVLLAILAGGCQPMPSMSTDYGAGYAPCGFQAVDNGMCPRVGYKRPIER